MPSQLETEARIRQMLDLLGIKVKKDEDVVENPEPLTVVTTRYEKNPCPVEGSTIDFCSLCRHKVNVSPSSKTMFEQRKKLGHEVQIVCVECLSNQLKD